ncbi:MAG: DUF4292 domain-containing protein [Saprospiraceae bacterium]|nr:DUF4292 domain-containing protein [Saprospiraceae bacterium]
MNSKQFSLAGMFLLLLSMSACSLKKAQTSANLKDNTPEGVMDQLVRHQLYAEWLDAKAKISYNDGYQSVTANAIIKMRKDSILWIAIKKLGFEVARMQVTRDSVYILDRLNNQYAIKDLNYLESSFNIPANLQMLQALVLGNPVFFTRKNLQMETAEGAYHLWGKDEMKENHFWMNRQLLLLEKTSLTDDRTGRKMALELKEHADLPDNQKFSYLRQLELNSRETGNVTAEISFSSVEINNPIEIRFEIPERYTRME